MPSTSAASSCSSFWWCQDRAHAVAHQFAAQQVHQRTLARTPVAGDRDGQRRMRVLVAQEVREPARQRPEGQRIGITRLQRLVGGRRIADRRGRCVFGARLAGCEQQQAEPEPPDRVQPRRRKACVDRPVAQHRIGVALAAAPGLAAVAGCQQHRPFAGDPATATVSSEAHAVEQLRARDVGLLPGRAAVEAAQDRAVHPDDKQAPAIGQHFHVVQGRRALGQAGNPLPVCTGVRSAPQPPAEVDRPAAADIGRRAHGVQHQTFMCAAPGRPVRAAIGHCQRAAVRAGRRSLQLVRCQAHRDQIGHPLRLHLPVHASVRTGKKNAILAGRHDPPAIGTAVERQQILPGAACQRLPVAPPVGGREQGAGRADQPATQAVGGKAHIEQGVCAAGCERHPVLAGRIGDECPSGRPEQEQPPVAHGRQPARLALAAARQRHEAGVVAPDLQHAALAGGPQLPAIGGQGDCRQVVHVDALTLPVFAAVVGHQQPAVLSADPAATAVGGEAHIECIHAAELHRLRRERFGQAQLQQRTFEPDDADPVATSHHVDRGQARLRAGRQREPARPTVDAREQRALLTGRPAVQGIDEAHGIQSRQRQRARRAGRLPAPAAVDRAQAQAVVADDPAVLRIDEPDAAQHLFAGLGEFDPLPVLAAIVGHEQRAGVTDRPAVAPVAQEVQGVQCRCARLRGFARHRCLLHRRGRPGLRIGRSGRGLRRSLVRHLAALADRAVQRWHGLGVRNGDARDGAACRAGVRRLRRHRPLPLPAQAVAGHVQDLASPGQQPGRAIVGDMQRVDRGREQRQTHEGVALERPAPERRIEPARWRAPGIRVRRLMQRKPGRAGEEQRSGQQQPEARLAQPAGAAGTGGRCGRGGRGFGHRRDSVLRPAPDRAGRSLQSGRCHPRDRAS